MRTDIAEMQIRAIAEMVADVDGEDADLLFDMIEGETSATTLIDAILEREIAAKTYIAANKATVDAIRARNARLQDRIDAGRRGLAKLLAAANVRDWERPLGTASIRAVPPSVIDGPLETLPEHLTKTTVTPDKTAIKEALKAGQAIDGWSLSNGGETVSVRMR